MVSEVATASVVWDLSRFRFLTEGDAPDTVNPSLWRQSRLVIQGGLYKVVDRLYQVRSAVLSNLTIVEGDTGLIVFDPLISVETAQAAMELYFAHRPRHDVERHGDAHSPDRRDHRDRPAHEHRRPRLRVPARP